MRTARFAAARPPHSGRRSVLALGIFENRHPSQPHNMKLHFLSLLLLIEGISVYALDETVISEAKYRDAKIVGVWNAESAESDIKIYSDSKIVWQKRTQFGIPDSSAVSWGPHDTKIAIELRTTKTTSEIHVIDLWDEKKEIQLPDLSEITKTLVSGINGRFRHLKPVGWVDQDTFVAAASGNLVDSITDPSSDCNFIYVYTIRLNSRRIISCVCASTHDLRAVKETEQQTKGK